MSLRGELGIKILKNQKSFMVYWIWWNNFEKKISSKFKQMKNRYKKSVKISIVDKSLMRYKYNLKKFFQSLFKKFDNANKKIWKKNIFIKTFMFWINNYQ